MQSPLNVCILFHKFVLLKKSIVKIIISLEHELCFLLSFYLINIRSKGKYLNNNPKQKGQNLLLHCFWGQGWGKNALQNID